MSCMECYEVFQSYPGKSWSQALEIVSDRRNSAGVERARKRFKEMKLSPLDLKQAQVMSDHTIDMAITCRYPILNQAEFVAQFGTEPAKMGIKMNGTIPNEEGVEEEVVICKPTTPRELVVTSRVSIRLSEGLLRRHIREEQARAVYEWAKKERLAKRPKVLCSKRRQRLHTLTQLRKASRAHNSELERHERAEGSEVGSGAGEEEDDESVAPVEPQAEEVWGGTILRSRIPKVSNIKSEACGKPDLSRAGVQPYSGGVRPLWA